MENPRCKKGSRNRPLVVEWLQDPTVRPGIGEEEGEFVLRGCGVQPLVEFGAEIPVQVG